MPIEKKQPPAPGIYRGVPFEEYLSWDAFSKSKVKHILRSPLHLKTAESANKETDAMRFGTLVDRLLFGEDINKIGILPEFYTDEKTGKLKPFTMASNACKEIYEEIELLSDLIVKPSEYEKALSVHKAIIEHKTAKQWLFDAEMNQGYQVSIVWVDTDTGVLCKGRFDMLAEQFVCDLKTTTDASPEAFSRKIFDFDYHVQAAMYLDGLQVLTGDAQLPWRFIVAESEIPHAVACYELDEQSIEIGRQRYKKAASLWMQAQLDPVVRGYSDFCEPISLPTWAIMRNLNAEQEIEDVI